MVKSYTIKTVLSELLKMNQRRTLITACISSLTTIHAFPIYARGNLDYTDIAAPFLPLHRLSGTKPALEPEEVRSRAILESAPKDCSLLEIAQYFEKLTDENTEGHKFNAQWPLRWNPVIIGFYRSTNLQDSYVFQRGDTISWCAAFVNWCLGHAGLKRTQSALSGSFRLAGGLGKTTTNPKPGDIIVFKKTDQKSADNGHGHVGIFVEEAPGGFKVLGGNQRAGKKHSSINTAFFPEKDSRLVLDSFRSVESIGRAN
jgi:uncharacterized protein (TIGR02594 family)